MNRRIMGLVIVIMLFMPHTVFADDLTIGLYDNEPLVISGDAPSGFLVDLIKEYFRARGVSLSFRSGSLSQVLEWVETGQVDLVPGIAFSESRSLLFDYNDEPLFLNWGEVFTPQGDPLHALLDLEKKRIGVQVGDIHYTGENGIANTLKQFEVSATFVPYDTKEALFLALQKGEVDAAVANRTYGFLHAESYGLQSSGIVFNPVRMHLIQPKNSSINFFSDFDRWLLAQKNEPSSRYHSLFSKWFDPPGSDATSRRLMVLLGFTGLITLFLGLSSLYLKSLVKDRTTELHQKNEALQQMNKNLEVLVDEQIHRMMSLKEEVTASEKMASLGRMVAGVAHEVNTPLGVSLTVTSYLESLHEDLERAFSKGALSEEHFQDYLQETDESVEILSHNLQRTIDLIERFKMLSTDYSDDHLRSFKLKEMVQRLVTSLGPELKKDQIDVVIDMDEDLVLTTYPSDFTSVLTNLIINAKKHAFTEQRAGQIKIKAQREDEGILLLLSDNGRGLTEEEKVHLFEPFYTTARDRGGTGLGLATVHSLVTGKMEGRIRAHSQSGQGTTFSIHLPMKKEPAL